jgi:dihydropyrimidinase
MPDPFDLVVRGATVVSPGRQDAADIGVQDGWIAQVGGEMTGREELAADGLLALPGGVDAHVHLMYRALAEELRRAGEIGPSEPMWVDDFWTGSLAAIGGGITTIGNMTFPLPGETARDAVAREMAGAAPEAAVDWFLHPVLTDLAAAADAEIAALAADGHTSVKIFLTVPQIEADEPGLRAALCAAREAGSLTLMHCEAAGLLEECGKHLIGDGRGALQNFAKARPVAAEVEAVDQAAALATATGAPVYIVHLSSAAALDRARTARSGGVAVHVETRPLYLHLTRERFAQPDAGKYVGAPPLREQADRDALWAGLAAGDVDTVCSDHAPWLLADKLDPALNVVTARQGVADLETLMPMLFSEGVVTGRISLDQFVHLTSANAARLFGLYPRKGVIAVGSDADLALWDPQERRTVDGARMRSRADYSVYDGWDVRGWPRIVVQRGQVLLADGEIIARPGQGQWLRRGTDR